MQDIRQETLNECTRAEQSASVVLWEIDLTEVGGERYFFCNEQNEKGEPVTWQGRQYQPYPIQGSGFELNGKGTSTRPTLTVSNLYGMVTGMAEDMQSLVGGTVVRRKVYARFLDAVNFVNGNSDADPEQEVISRWRIEQCSELSAVSASFVLSTPTETDGAVFPGRIMLANTCTWTYRGDECGYHGPAGDAYIPPHTGLPANSTDIAPPDIPAGFVAVFNSDEASWHLVEDHRGKTVYDVASGDALFISELGPLPKNVTWLSPEGEFQKWNGTAWVKDTEAEKLFRIREAEETKNNLMQVASEHIAPLQDAADLEIATEEEISLLEAWKKYRVLLNRVDTSTAQDIEWPALP